MLKTKPGRVPLAAHALPEFLQCSECGCAPLPKEQPELIELYKKYMKKHRPRKKRNS